MIFTTPQIQVIQAHLETKIPELLTEFKIHLSKGYRYYSGCCPIHDGDNSAAFALYHNDNQHGVINYKCFTHGCHQHFKGTLIAFVRGVLSRKRYEWKRPDDLEVNLGDTCKWCMDFLGLKYSDLKTENLSEAQLAFINNWSRVSAVQKVNSVAELTRQEVRKRLVIPAEYYIKRGVPREILDIHDVGLCVTPGKEMSNRVTVPVFDENYKYVLGCLGRSIFPQCVKCRLYHDAKVNCPAAQHERFYKKWRNSTGFDRRFSLYGYWLNKQEIQRTGVAVLVESPGNVWRLKECGINNGVGLYGTDLTEEQQIILEKTGIFTVAILMDNGQAGRQAETELIKRLKPFYKVVPLPVIYKDDIAERELSNEVIKETYLPILEGLKRKR